MDRTLKLLESVDYGKLSNERKANYEAAKRFITQAEDAVKANNYVFAKSLADRAEMLAKELAGRWGVEIRAGRQTPRPAVQSAHILRVP